MCKEKSLILLNYRKCKGTVERKGYVMKSLNILVKILRMACSIQNKAEHNHPLIGMNTRYYNSLFYDKNAYMLGIFFEQRKVSVDNHKIKRNFQWMMCQQVSQWQLFLNWFSLCINNTEFLVFINMCI